ncbi:hypothetical protein JX265_007746 [Neoarthrinium moseri]|uniref:Short-chain dehydrogenase n=1 Tax=Neoarthrinium moseri TaxID=1658444 RepID=A0A9P9WJB0_9PEZI|nr:uncharacterized protein JN550_003323 [Neoarthrinium moseri]KAI1855421.1 hypothetical protein JX266_000286 [Neoarthrinium moseri]KAI1866445.1 hypothetical protein JX265_007746 [Neoarthrinium moseri]KAI1873070.1 hypothetical protein JN550_003323 [Neoarthrinium moseri]
METENTAKFRGGVAVITGAGAGIGSGLARQCASIGMTVVVTDVSSDRAEEVADQIRKSGGEADAMTVDVSHFKALDALAEAVYAKYGNRVRLLINNAGIETLGFSWEIPAERWESTLNINIHGIVHGARAFIPRMLASGQECWIANLASVGAFGVMPTQTAYIMSKHAVQSFSECLYLEMKVKQAPIHVSSVVPGMLKTSIFDAGAGAGEPQGAETYRSRMYHMMKDYGMDLDAGCKRIIEGICANKFWVDTQPEMTTGALQGRAKFLTEQRDPEIADEARHLLGLS